MCYPFLFLHPFVSLSLLLWSFPLSFLFRLVLTIHQSVWCTPLFSFSPHRMTSLLLHRLPLFIPSLILFPSSCSLSSILYSLSSDQSSMSMASFHSPSFFLPLRAFSSPPERICVFLCVSPSHTSCFGFHETWQKINHERNLFFFFYPSNQLLLRNRDIHATDRRKVIINKGSKSHLWKWQSNGSWGHHQHYSLLLSFG